MAWTETMEVFDVLQLMNVAMKLTTVFLSTVPTKIVSLQVHPNVSIKTKVSLVMVLLVSVPKKVECVLILTNATQMTEKMMSMLIDSMI